MSNPDTPNPAEQADRMSLVSDLACSVAEEVWSDDEPTLAEYELAEAILAAANVEAVRLGRRLAAVEAVADEWGITEAGVFAEDFTEAIADSGAWRFARDLRAALSVGEADPAQDS